MEFDLIKEDIVLDEFFKVYKARLKFEKFDGSMSKAVDRCSFEKGDAVAVLIYHLSKNAYVLVRQFRYPPVHHNTDPWLAEIVAGGIEENEEESAAAQREVEEETGYTPLRLEKICKCY